MNITKNGSSTPFMGLVGRPNIKPARNSGAAAVVAKASAADFFQVEVDTTDNNITENSRIVLFDAGGGYQLNNNFTMDPNVVIRGITADYQWKLNYLSRTASYFDIVRMTVTNAQAGAFDAQFDQKIEVHYSDLNGTEVANRVFPAKGIHEGQYQSSIVTFRAAHVLDYRMAFVYDQLPGKKVTWSFFQRAEVGGIQ
jgi:hypothetical protein